MKRLALPLSYAHSLNFFLHATSCLLSLLSLTLFTRRHNTSRQYTTLGVISFVYAFMQPRWRVLWYMLVDQSAAGQRLKDGGFSCGRTVTAAWLQPSGIRQTVTIPRLNYIDSGPSILYCRFSYNTGSIVYKIEICDQIMWSYNQGGLKIKRLFKYMDICKQV